MNRLHIFAETFHIIEVGVHRVKALYAGCTGSDDHVLTCTHQFHACSGNGSLQVLRIVAAGQSNTEQQRG